MQTYKHHANMHLNTKWHLKPTQTYKNHANMHITYKLAFETNANIQTQCKHAFKIQIGI
jgi:hypothetical protein